jgi:hypothetical protein
MQNLLWDVRRGQYDKRVSDFVDLLMVGNLDVGMET